MFENVSDTVYKAVYDSVAKYGLADEAKNNTSISNLIFSF